MKKIAGQTAPAGVVPGRHRGAKLDMRSSRPGNLVLHDLGIIIDFSGESGDQIGESCVALHCADAMRRELTAAVTAKFLRILQPKGLANRHMQIRKAGFFDHLAPARDRCLGVGQQGYPVDLQKRGAVNLDIALGFKVFQAGLDE